MKVVAILILAIFQLVGLPAPGQRQLENTALSRGNYQLALPHAALLTPVKTGSESLQVGAASVLAWDLTTATPLYAKAADQKRPIASITKLVTALVILKEHDLTKTVTIPALPAHPAQDVTMGLRAGQVFKLQDLLSAALIPSANDAAEALAIIDSGTIEAFSAKMNRLASEWGISDTHFTNPSGLSDQDNYTTAIGLAKLGKLALTNPMLAKIVSTAQTTISDTTGRPYNLVTTDQLLITGQVKGIKTGFTEAAGECFLGLAEINGHKIITVVLGSPDRFGETTKLIDYIERNYSWQ